jgi:hypothetical protein
MLILGVKAVPDERFSRRFKDAAADLGDDRNSRLLSLGAQARRLGDKCFLKNNMRANV